MQVPRGAEMVTDEQVRLLRQKRMEGKTQEAAAAAAGMSVRTAREWERGALPSETKPPRSWRTRSDPFEDVWESEIEPLLVRDTDARARVDDLVRAARGALPGSLRRGPGPDAAAAGARLARAAWAGAGGLLRAGRTRRAARRRSTSRTPASSA